jgi:hypothetical protein
MLLAVLVLTPLRQGPRQGVRNTNPPPSPSFPPSLPLFSPPAAAFMQPPSVLRGRGRGREGPGPVPAPAGRGGRGRGAPAAAAAAAVDLSGAAPSPLLGAGTSGEITVFASSAAAVSSGGLSFDRAIHEEYDPGRPNDYEDVRKQREQQRLEVRGAR